MIAGHDDEELVIEEGGVLAGGGVGRLLVVGVGGGVVVGVVAGVEVAGELPVGAGQDEEGEGDKAEHRRQAAEEVGDRRLPRRVVPARGGGRHRCLGCATGLVETCCRPHNKARFEIGEMKREEDDRSMGMREIYEAERCEVFIMADVMPSKNKSIAYYRPF